MATLAKLCADKVLVKLTVRLSRYEFENRQIYAYPEMIDWLQNVLPDLKPIDPSNLSPKEQFLTLLRHFVTGKPMIAPRMYRKMTPLPGDVFELKTPDLRVFGWFFRKDAFVAVSADEIVNLKTHNLYPGYHVKVVKARKDLELNEPKCLWGAKEDDVISI